jgi:prepilin-type N-terminal cleavage/methylation domain-containing protein
MIPHISLRRRSGFTMIELMMTMTIMSLMGSLALTQFLDFSLEARASTVKETLTNMRAGISNQLAQYKLRCGGNAQQVSQVGVPLTLINHFMVNDITARESIAAEKICNDDEVSSTTERQFITVSGGALAHMIDVGNVDLGTLGNIVPANPLLLTNNTDATDQIYYTGIPGPAAMTPTEVCDLVDSWAGTNYRAHWIWDSYDGSIHPGTNTPGIHECLY